MRSKDEAFKFVHDLVLRLKNELLHSMRAIWSDNETEFWNARFDAFCSDQGLDHQYSSPYTPQQNGVVERKNRTLVEMARTMLDEHRTPRKYWTEAVNTACYVSNRIFLHAFLHKTSFEFRFGRQPNVSHLRVFGCRCFVLKEGLLDKFESRSSDGIFMGYSSHSRAYHVLNLETNVIVESCEVTFDETAPGTSSSFELAGDDEVGTSIFEDEHDVGAGPSAPAAELAPSSSSSDDEGGPTPSPSTSREPPQPSTASEAVPEVLPRDAPEAGGAAGDVGEVTSEPIPARVRKCRQDHPPEGVIGHTTARYVTRSKVTSLAVFAHSAFVAFFEPRDIGHALSDSNWINAMHEELENFERNQVWVLVEPPPQCNPIGTKWVFKNKQGEDGVVVRNKARLVAQGFCQKEGIEYEEIFAPVALLTLLSTPICIPQAHGSCSFSLRVFPQGLSIRGLTKTT